MKLLQGILFALVLTVLAAAAILWTGMLDFAASTPTGKLEQGLATFALNRSVARHAPATRNPIAASPEVFRDGLGHFRENCVACHGAPGVDASEFGQGLNPPAPDLTLPRVQARSDGQLFWIVSNGIRMTGMPAFSPTHKPEEIWKIVAFVRHLPELTPAEEKALKPAEEAAEHHGGASGGGEAKPKSD